MPELTVHTFNHQYHKYKIKHVAQIKDKSRAIDMLIKS